MALKGDLASVDLAQVFQMLALNQKVGMLFIQSPRAWKGLYFEPAGCCLYFNEHVLLDKVLAQVTLTGRMTPEVAKEVREHAVEQGISVADALLAGGYLTEADLASSLRVEMEEEIYDLFFWNDAHFEFFEGATTLDDREGLADTRYLFSTDSLIMEAARRIDEWSFIKERVEGPLEVYTPLEDGSGALDLEEPCLALLDLVDGKRNVARLIEITGLAPFLVYKGLAVLLDEKIIEAVQPGDLLITAQECVHEGRIQDSINLYEKAISLDVGIPDSHDLVAVEYEKMEELELAAYHQKCVAEYYAADGNIKGAVAILHHVIQMLPTDLAARERLVELTVGRADLAARGFDPIEHGKDLVDLYLEIGEIDKVRGILERLLRDNPFDIELKKSLINVHTKAGDTRRVIELYESIAEDLVQASQPIEAIKYLQKILMLDRGRKDISERIRSLYVLDERRRSRRRRMTFMAVFVCVAVVLAGAYYFYDKYARKQLAHVDRVVADLIKEDHFAAAAEEYKKFLEQFPLTLVSAEVDVKLSHVETQKKLHEAAIAQQTRKREQELKKLRATYELGFENYKTYFKRSELERALEQLESIQDLVEQAGQPADRKWMKDSRIAEEMRSLKDYLSGAIALDREAHAKLEKGDWAGARNAWLELIDEFQMSATAKSVRLPVYLRTRPAGAEVWVGGKRVMEPSGSRKAKLTPCLLMCRHDVPERIVFKKPGFDEYEITIEAKKFAFADETLTAIPKETFKFEQPVLGDISVSRTTLAGGLRGGKVALARLGSTAPQAVVNLQGLDELEGRVQLSSTMAVFLTREHHLYGFSLTSSKKLWQRTLQSAPTHDVILQAGRVLFADAQNRMHAWDAAKGRPLWFRPLSGPVLGRPIADGPKLRVPTADGWVYVLDVTNGTILSRVRVPDGIVTEVESADGALIFGTRDGEIFALMENNGRVAWKFRLPDTHAPESVLVANDDVLVVDTDRNLYRLGLRDGVEKGRLQLKGDIVSGPVLSGDYVLFTLRELNRSGRELDVLRAIELETLEIDWEYRDDGKFAAGVVANEEGIFLPDSSGQIQRF